MKKKKKTLLSSITNVTSCQSSTVNLRKSNQSLYWQTECIVINRTGNNRDVTEFGTLIKDSSGIGLYACCNQQNMNSSLKVCCSVQQGFVIIAYSGSEGRQVATVLIALKAYVSRQF